MSDRAASSETTGTSGPDTDAAAETYLKFQLDNAQVSSLDINASGTEVAGPGPESGDLAIEEADNAVADGHEEEIDVRGVHWNVSQDGTDTADPDPATTELGVTDPDGAARPADLTARDAGGAADGDDQLEIMSFSWGETQEGTTFDTSDPDPAATELGVTGPDDAAHAGHDGWVEIQPITPILTKPGAGGAADVDPEPKPEPAIEGAGAEGQTDGYELEPATITSYNLGALDHDTSAEPDRIDLAGPTGGAETTPITLEPVMVTSYQTGGGAEGPIEPLETDGLVGPATIAAPGDDLFDPVDDLGGPTLTDLDASGQVLHVGVGTDPLDTVDDIAGGIGLDDVLDL